MKSKIFNSKMTVHFLDIDQIHCELKKHKTEK